MKNKINILIADDHAVFRYGMVNLLNEIDIINQVEEAENGMEVLKKVQTMQVDVVFLDIHMPVMDGMETLDHLNQLETRPKVIILSMYSDRKKIIDFYTRNIDGFLFKNTSLPELKRVIYKVLDGENYYSQSVAKVLFDTLLRENETGISIDKIGTISVQEQKVLSLICLQYSSEEIAQKLHLSTMTIKRHRQNLMAKTGSDNVVGLALFALKHGLVEIE